VRFHSCLACFLMSRSWYQLMAIHPLPDAEHRTLGNA
jgi:hypothetical protein